MNNLCVSCGAIIPEGRQICPKCEKEEFTTRPIQYSDFLEYGSKKKRHKKPNYKR